MKVIKVNNRVSLFRVFVERLFLFFFFFTVKVSRLELKEMGKTWRYRDGSPEFEV